MLKLVVVILSVFLFCIACDSSSDKDKTSLKRQLEEGKRLAERGEEIWKGGFRKEKNSHTNGYEKDFVYPWDLLKDEEFKSLYYQALGKLNNVYWIKKMQGVGSPVKKLILDGKEYLFITFCKPHACNTDFVLLLYNPQNKEIFGYYVSEKGKYPIGNIDKNKEKLLNRAYAKTNSIGIPLYLENKPLLTIDDIDIEKVEKCPPIEKKLVLTPLSENDKDLFKIILREAEKSFKLDEGSLGYITPDQVYVAFADVNDDGKIDVIYSIFSTMFCGSIGCHIDVLLNEGNGKYKNINLGLISGDKIYITTEKKHGFRTLILDENIKMVYDGKAYDLGGKCDAE